MLELSSASMDLHFTAVLELALLVLLALLLAQLADLSLDLDLDLDSALPPSPEELDVHTDVDTQPALLEDTNTGEQPIK